MTLPLQRRKPSGPKERIHFDDSFKLIDAGTDFLLHDSPYRRLRP
jgi:hypothetical protein